MSEFNAHAPENTHSLNAAVMWLFQQRAQSVYIATPEQDVALAVLRRLGWVQGNIYVMDGGLAAAGDQLGMQVRVYEQGQPVEAVIVPFSRQHFEQPPQARLIVVIGHNGLSYKSLLKPGQIGDTLGRMTRWLQAGYDVSFQVGVLGLTFIIPWTLAVLAGSRRPVTHFRVGQYAMDRIVSQGRLWWTGYVIVLGGVER